MLNFLKQSRKFVNAPGSTCLVVIGNESCDLDSAASALCLAYFYNKYNENSTRHYLPVLNVPRRDYPLKTEVKFLFSQHQITDDMLTFRDELHEDFLKRNNFILVDHHVSPFTRQCVEVHDHRPRDPSVAFPEHCKVNLGLVGSCATLIAEYAIGRMKEGSMTSDDAVALQLLRSTIILDTVNFSPSAARATDRDVQMCNKLEERLHQQHSVLERSEEFERLRVARADMSSLSPLQILRKDLKIIENTKERIALPGFPMRVQDFIRIPMAMEAVQEFARDTQTSIVILMGMYVDENDNNRVHRDVGLITLEGQSALYLAIEERLLASKEPDLQLKPLACDFMKGRFYRQDNIKATRKHVLPIIKMEMDRCVCDGQTVSV